MTGGTNDDPLPALMPGGSGPVAPFWVRKSLNDMTAAEWEALCDGCGRCCLIKLEDEEDGTVYPTNLACTLFDLKTCRCSDYTNRKARVPSCIRLDPETVERVHWLPPTCAYRLLANGEPLRWWHPLVSGTADTVIAAGISVRDRVVSEDTVPEHDMEDFVADWPIEDPDTA